MSDGDWDSKSPNRGTLQSFKTNICNHNFQSKREHFKIGDFVKMVDCAEANIKKYKDTVWIVCSEPWSLGHGVEVVKLEG